MSGVVVYGGALSNFVRAVLLTLEEKGVPYANERIELHTPEHYALNPFGKVPILRHGDFVLAESQAICRYIDEAFDGPSLRPGDLKQRAVVDQWVAGIADGVAGAIIRNYVLAYLIPKFRNLPLDPEKVAAGVPGMKKAVETMDRHLEGRDWVAGDGLTLADLFLAPCAAALQGFPESKEAWEAAPNLQRWFARIATRPSWTKTQPKMG